MMNTLEHNGYQGSWEIDFENGILSGKIKDITDLVTYEADTPHGLKKAFEEAVDDYIKVRAEITQQVPSPQHKPMFPDAAKQVSIIFDGVKYQPWTPFQPTEPTLLGLGLKMIWIQTQEGGFEKWIDDRKASGTPASLARVVKGLNVFGLKGLQRIAFWVKFRLEGNLHLRSESTVDHRLLVYMLSTPVVIVQNRYVTTNGDTGLAYRQYHYTLYDIYQHEEFISESLLNALSKPENESFLNFFIAC